jgi:hypothetical protein
MNKILLMFLAILFLFPISAFGKVCFSCRGKKPVPYVCAQRDTFTARRNARKLGCKINSYSSSCKCGASVSHKSHFQYSPSVSPVTTIRNHSPKLDNLYNYNYIISFIRSVSSILAPLL